MKNRKKVTLVIIEKDGVKVEAKNCTKCDVVKPLTEFQKGKGKGGKYQHCIACHNKHGHKRKQKGRSQVKEVGNGEKLKLCLECKEWYPLSHYGKNQKCIEGLSPKCKVCVKAKERQAWELLKENPEQYADRLVSMSKYYYDNHEKNLARKRENYAINSEQIIQKVTAWQRNNPERKRRYKANRSAMKRHLTNTMTNEQQLMILQDFNYCCALTTLGQKYEWDHFIPLSWGHGGTYLGNVYPLVRNHNYSKRHKNPFVWIDYYPEYQESFTNIVNYLARQSELSPDEFREFVYWCDENRRTAEQVEADNRSSLEIWRAEKKSN